MKKFHWFYLAEEFIPALTQGVLKNRKGMILILHLQPETPWTQLSKEFISIVSNIRKQYHFYFNYYIVNQDIQKPWLKLLCFQ